MAINSLTYRQISPTQYEFSFSSDLSDPTFYVYLNGEFVTTTLETIYVATVFLDEQIQFDVFDDPSGVPAEHFPSKMTLRWEGRDGVNSYRVDRYLEAAWVPQDFIPARTSNLYHYVSPKLADSTIHKFRVVPLNSEGLSVSTLEFTAEMCRYPDAPAQTMAFVAGELSIT